MLFSIAESKGGSRVIRILYHELEIGPIQANEVEEKVFELQKATQFSAAQHSIE